jgi:hypothetical protein
MKIFAWGVVIVGLCYAAYSGMIAAWSWIAVSNAVDEVISREGIDAVPEPEIKARIVASTGESGVALSDRDVAIVRQDRATKVEVAWTIPLVVIQGDPLLTLPLSVTRTSAPR